MEGAQQRVDGHAYLLMWQAWQVGRFVLDALAVAQPKSRHRYPTWTSVDHEWQRSKRGAAHEPQDAWRVHQQRMRSLAAVRRRRTRQGGKPE